jgi:hypothetical protein
MSANSKQRAKRTASASTEPDANKRQNTATTTTAPSPGAAAAAAASVKHVDSDVKEKPIANTKRTKKHSLSQVRSWAEKEYMVDGLVWTKIDPAKAAGLEFKDCVRLMLRSITNVCAGMNRETTRGWFKKVWDYDGPRLCDKEKTVAAIADDRKRFPAEGCNSIGQVFEYGEIYMGAEGDHAVFFPETTLAVYAALLKVDSNLTDLGTPTLPPVVERKSLAKPGSKNALEDGVSPGHRLLISALANHIHNVFIVYAIWTYCPDVQVATSPFHTAHYENAFDYAFPGGPDRGDYPTVDISAAADRVDALEKKPTPLVHRLAHLATAGLDITHRMSRLWPEPERKADPTDHLFLQCRDHPATHEPMVYVTSTVAIKDADGMPERDLGVWICPICTAYTFQYKSAPRWNTHYPWCPRTHGLCAKRGENPVKIMSPYFHVPSADDVNKLIACAVDGSIGDDNDQPHSQSLLLYHDA